MSSLHHESEEEIDIEAVLESIDTCFNAYADDMDPCIATHILDFLTQCILQKAAEGNQNNTIALIQFWNTKLNPSASENPSLTKLYQEKLADVLFQIEPSIASQADTKINFADILAKQAAILYQASRLNVQYDQAYNLKLEALLLALSNKKGTNENRGELPENLNTHRHYLAALKKIHAHLIKLGFAMKITIPGLSTDMTTAPKFVSFFKDNRARDDNSMKPYTPQIRAHEI